MSRTLCVRTVLDNTGKFIAPIDVPFDPSEFTIKQITYRGDPVAQEVGVFEIWLENIAEYIGSAFDGSCVAPNLTFPIDGPYINKKSTLKFEVHSTLGTLDEGRTGSLTLHIELKQ